MRVRSETMPRSAYRLHVANVSQDARCDEFQPGGAGAQAPRGAAVAPGNHAQKAKQPNMLLRLMSRAQCQRV
jgi:hypothetical protein